MTDREIVERVDAWIESRELEGELAALADLWHEVSGRYGPQSAPALGVLLAMVRATGTDENGEQTIELHIGPECFAVGVLWFDADGGDDVEYWDLAEALIAALEADPQ